MNYQIVISYISYITKAISQKVLAFSTLQLQKMSLLTSLLHFVYWFMSSLYSYRSSDYCDPIVVALSHFFSILKAMAKSKRVLMAFKSDNFTRSNIEISNIAKALMENSKAQI